MISLLTVNMILVYLKHDNVIILFSPYSKRHKTPASVKTNWEGEKKPLL